MAVDVLGLQSEVIVVQPEFIPECDASKGCLLSSNEETVGVSGFVRVAQRYQVWSGDFLKHNGVQTSSTIGIYGCDVVSQAVILTKFSGLSKTAKDVNNSLSDSHSFNAATFEQVYTTYIDFKYSLNITNMSEAEIYDLLEPKFAAVYVAVIRSEKSANDNSGHYEIAYMNYKRTDYYENTTIITKEVLVIDSSNYNDYYLRHFLARYPYPTYVYFFADKTN